MENALRCINMLHSDKYSIQLKKNYCYEIDFIFKFTKDVYKEYDEYLYNMEEHEDTEEYCFHTRYLRNIMNDSFYFDYFLDFMREKYKRPDLLLIDENEIHITDVYIQPNFKINFYINNRATYCGTDRCINSRSYKKEDFNLKCKIDMNIIFIKLIK